MSPEDILEINGYNTEDIVLFKDYDYSSALIGVSSDGRAVYDYDLMIDYLVEKHTFVYEEAIEWINYNTVRALDYYSDSRKPIIVRLLRKEE